MVVNLRKYEIFIYKFFNTGHNSNKNFEIHVKKTINPIDEN